VFCDKKTDIDTNAAKIITKNKMLNAHVKLSNHLLFFCFEGGGGPSISPVLASEMFLLPTPTESVVASNCPQRHTKAHTSPTTQDAQKV